jgi:hypothetical protein
MSRKLLTSASLLVLVLLLSACGANIRFSPFAAEETVTQSFTTAAAPRVVVEMFNGSIDVATGTDNTVNIDVKKRGGGISQAAAEDDLKNVEVIFAQDGDTIRVTARRTDQRVDLGNTGASARLRVPSGAILDLRSSNASITASGPVADVTAQTSNGPITVRGALGQLVLNTSNGPLTIDGGSGLLDVETSNAPIDIAADNVAVNGRTSNGSFHFSGSLASGRSEMNTSNSSIVVTLPAGAQFVVDADTSNSRISSDFAVTAQDFSDDRLQGTVGNDPDATLELHTSNGPIEIRRSR